MKPHSKWTHVLVFDGSCEGLAAPKSQILLALARRHRRIITTSTLHAIDPLLFSCVSQYLRMLARRLAQISNRVVVRFVAGMTLSDRFQLHLSPRPCHGSATPHGRNGPEDREARRRVEKRLLRYAGFLPCEQSASKRIRYQGERGRAA